MAGLQNPDFVEAPKRVDYITRPCLKMLSTCVASEETYGACSGLVICG